MTQQVEMKPLCPENPAGTLGKSGERHLYEWSEALVVASSILLSSLAIIIVFYQPVAVNIGQNYQLIIIGLLLSLMNLCTETISAVVFIQLERRWSSILQNYDVIIKKSLLGSIANRRVVSHRWIPTLSVATVLPLALSAAYKRFTGGIALTSPSRSEGTYGLTAPLGLDSFGGRGLSFMINATLPLITNPPRSSIADTGSRSFGFNMLIINDTRVAMLDAPAPTYIRSLRKDIGADGSLLLTAEVQAITYTMKQAMLDKEQEDNFSDYFYKRAESHQPMTLALPFTTNDTNTTLALLSRKHNTYNVLLATYDSSLHSDNFISKEKKAFQETAMGCPAIVDLAEATGVSRVKVLNLLMLAVKQHLIKRFCHSPAKHWNSSSMRTSSATSSEIPRPQIIVISPPNALL